MALLSATADLIITDLAGGFPGHIDAMRRFLQAPAMAKRVPPDVREQFLSEDPFGADGDGTATDQQEIVKTGFRKTADGEYWIGAFQVKAALQQAAKSLYTTTSRPSIYQMARAITYSLEVVPHQIVLRDVGDERTVEITQIIAHPRNPQIKVPSIRQRQVLATATCSVRFLVQSRGVGELLRDELEELLETAGMFVGLGTDRGYGHGRFIVDGFRWGGLAPTAERAALEERAAREPRRKGIKRTD